MKNFLRLSLTAIALTFFFNAFAITEAKAQNFLPEILKRMDANNKLLKSLNANIKMNKYNAQLDENDLTEGTAMYLPAEGKRQMYVRIDWTKPVQESLAVVNGTYTLYRPRLKQAIEGKVDQKKKDAKVAPVLAFTSMSKQQLQANYTVKYMGQEKVSSGVQTFRLELTPKTATGYKYAELWVDVDGMPVQAKVVENNKDETTVLLYNLQKNVMINASVFTINLPKDTKIIKG